MRVNGLNRGYSSGNELYQFDGSYFFICDGGCT